MKKTSRLFLTICSLAIALTGVIFGVYAATTQTVSITSNISFTSTQALARIDLEILNAVDSSGNAIVFNQTLYNYKIQGATSSVSKTLSSSADFGANAIDKIYFNITDYANIIFRYTIKNYSYEKRIAVTNNSLTPSATGDPAIGLEFGSTLPLNVATNSTQTLDVILSVANASKNISSVGVNVNLVFNAIT